MAARPARAAPEKAAAALLGSRPPGRGGQWALQLSTAELGVLSEELAARHLRQAGFDLIGRNLDAKEAELDIVAFDGNTLVVVEVKAGWWPRPPHAPREGDDALPPGSSSPPRRHQRPASRVTPEALRRRQAAARRMAASTGHGTARVDVLEVITGRGPKAIMVHHHGIPPNGPSAWRPV